jgi:hypothetical protein
MTAAAAYAAARAFVHRPTRAAASAPAPLDSSASGGPTHGGDEISGPPDDSWRLMVLLAVFVVSPLVVVGALWAMVAIDTLWALVGALGVYAITTAVVFATVAFVLAGHAPRSGPHRHDG